MTNKKFKLAAMSLATAVAVSTVGPSASAVTYYLGDGSVTVDQDENRGAYSYQGEDGSEEHRTYVNEDEADHGVINVKDGHAPTTDNSNNGTAETTSTDNTTDPSGNNTENSSTSETTTTNTITVKEDVTGATIVVDGVNADTSETGKSTVTIGEGADVDLTVKDSNLTTGGNGIDIGVNLKDDDENKKTNVDLTLDHTEINLTEKR